MTRLWSHFECNCILGGESALPVTIKKQNVTTGTILKPDTKVQYLDAIWLWNQIVTRLVLAVQKLYQSGIQILAVVLSLILWLLRNNNFWGFFIDKCVSCFLSIVSGFSVRSNLLDATISTVTFRISEEGDISTKWQTKWNYLLLC